MGWGAKVSDRTQSIDESANISMSLPVLAEKNWHSCKWRRFKDWGSVRDTMPEQSREPVTFTLFHPSGLGFQNWGLFKVFAYSEHTCWIKGKGIRNIQNVSCCCNLCYTIPGTNEPTCYVPAHTYFIEIFQLCNHVCLTWLVSIDETAETLHVVGWLNSITPSSSKRNSFRSHPVSVCDRVTPTSSAKFGTELDGTDLWS